MQKFIVAITVLLATTKATAYVYAYGLLAGDLQWCYPKHRASDNLSRKDPHMNFKLVVSSVIAEPYINKSHTKPWRVRFYPKKSLFRKADLIDQGCAVFLKDCPTVYKAHLACGRHYDGNYKTFNNYCELEYENCNSWRKWSLIKQGKC